MSYSQYIIDCRQIKYTTLLTYVGSRYSALLIPHSPGAPFDLASDSSFSEILMHFVQEKSACTFSTICFAVQAICHILIDIMKIIYLFVVYFRAYMRNWTRCCCPVFYKGREECLAVCQLQSHLCECRKDLLF